MARTEEEQAAFEAMPADAAEEPGFILHLFRAYDLNLRWWTISANRDPEIVRDLLNHPKIMPGFNDSGAHITNMAFYDGNLRCLQIAQAEGLDRVASQIKRLTSEPADFIGVDAGRLQEGARADIAVVDPKASGSL
jgi:N-acyl-D-aspartate/D-glutamate deacylase